MPFVWSTSEQTAHQWKAKSPTPRLTVVSQVNRNEFVLTYSWKSDCKSSPIAFSGFSKTLATQKSRHAITHIKAQLIRPLSDSWILVFSKLLQLQATCSTVRGTGSSLSMAISSWCCSLPFCISVPLKSLVSDLLPAPKYFFLLPQLSFARSAASYLFSHSGLIASETLGWRRQDDKHKYPLLQHQQRRRKVLCQGGGWHFLRAEYKLCGTPSPPHICVSLLLKYL